MKADGINKRENGRNMKMKRFKTMKWAMFALAFICCLCPFFGVKVNAQTTIKYDVKEENGILSCTYMKTEKTYGYKHNCSKRYTMTIKNGKVYWK